jgi:hypothetical protein
LANFSLLLTPKAFANFSLLLTPKAFANFSPGFERSENPGIDHLSFQSTLKGFGGWRTLSGLAISLGVVIPGLSLRSNPGLKLANAFGVIIKNLICINWDRV